MAKVLIVVDMQNDFIDGVLGTNEAQAIVSRVVDKIKNFDGYVFATMDTHHNNYYKTQEGRNLPLKHCIKYTHGWEFPHEIDAALKEKNGITIIKNDAFGEITLPDEIWREVFIEREDLIDSFEFVGVCTDICVIANAMILKADCPDMPIYIDASCCAGTTPEMHRKALDVMRSCQFYIKGE